ncbi:MAG: alpha/beta hydrolase [Candidatus Promineifilaceae bacterium]|nr:alpha/beta hydrolase [Candidatus Promineifilaceae bacterium]
MDHHYVVTNGVRLHVVQAGPPDGALVILLHGFPEFWFGWRQQIPALAAAGFRVWAPDQRGYNLSAKPRGLAAYDLDKLAGDVLGLIDAAGRQRAAVVGHDWGGFVAWWLAAHAPRRLSHLVILNAPHGAAMARHLRRNPAQWRRSWYALGFQLPWLPELVSRWRNWRLLVAGLRASSHPGTFGESALAHYRQAWSRPGAYTAMLNWYRAVFRRPARLGALPSITVPTLLIWGAQEQFFVPELAPKSLAHCPAGRLVMVEEATHWVQHEAAERVNALMASFLYD